jgi:hypothetical protein
MEESCEPLTGVKGEGDYILTHNQNMELTKNDMKYQVKFCECFINSKMSCFVRFKLLFLLDVCNEN